MGGPARRLARGVRIITRGRGKLTRSQPIIDHLSAILVACNTSAKLLLPGTAELARLGFPVRDRGVEEAAQVFDVRSGFETSALPDGPHLGELGGDSTGVGFE